MTNGCINFLDRKIINLARPFAKLGKCLIGTIKGKNSTVLNCLVRQAESKVKPECRHHPLRLLKSSTTVVEKPLSCTLLDVQRFCDEAAEVLRGYGRRRSAKKAPEIKSAKRRRVDN